MCFHILFTQSSVWGHLGSFHLQAFVNMFTKHMFCEYVQAALNMDVHVQIFVSSHCFQLNSCFLTFLYQALFTSADLTISFPQKLISYILLFSWENKTERRGVSHIAYFFLFFFICSGFCHTLKWNSHGFTCVPYPDPPSHLPLPPLPLGFPSAPGPSACLMHPTWAGDLFHPR